METFGKLHVMLQSVKQQTNSVSARGKASSVFSRAGSLRVAQAADSSVWDIAQMPMLCIA